MKRFFLSVLALSLASFCSVVSADVRVTQIFTDNMVLQRDVPVKIWGTADVGEDVAVEFNGQTAKTTTAEDGKWVVELKAMPALCEGKDLIITGKNQLTLKNVVVGEVWICSGQSNMEQPLNSWGQPRNACTDEEITGDYSFVRFNRANHVQASEPKADLQSTGWRLCKDGVQKDCTACGFHFAVRLHKELNVPVGLIDSNWGGSNIDSWVPDEGWFRLPELKTIAESVKANREANKPDGHGGMYYAMLAPWTQYAIKGAIWYQGCTNAGEGGFYYYKQKAMIQEWRSLWGQEFPFYWVQLANFAGISDNPNEQLGWAQIRDAQTRCMDVPKTGQAVIIDVGEDNDIHPRNKFSVGNRLAVWALTKDYGKPCPHASPLFKEAKFDGNKVTATFTNVGEGLVVGKQTDRTFAVDADAPIKRVAIAGADKKYFWADVKIVGKDSLEATSPSVPEPKFIRYAWQQNPTGCNLYNAEGLPVTPFTSEK